MKNITIFLISIVSLTGCANYQQAVQRNKAEVDQAMSDLRSAMEFSTAYCKDKKSCDKAFSLAKVYVQNNSDMKIQSSDDTIISTFNPFDYGYVGLSVTKTPGKGDSASITISATCKGMYDGSLFQKNCAKKIAPIYRGFNSFISNRIE